MDPFVFDTKFARFLSQVDSHEIRRGTLLYENGQARVTKVSSALIEGFVKAPDGSAHHVKLQDNGEGGLSGSCSCDTFFNCSHAYALSRATRDHLQQKTPKSPSPPSPAAKTPAASAPSRPVSPPSPIQKLWQQTKNGKLPLFPNDLAAFTESKRRPPLPLKEPLRELKRFLPPQGPQTMEDFADAIRAFCDQKRISLSSDFKTATDPSQANTRYLAYKKSQRADSWKDAPPPLAFDYKFEPTENRDWFELTLVPKIKGHSFSQDEIEQLIKANGELIYLKGHGWRRVEPGAAEKHARQLAGLGIDTQSGRSLRVHALQADALLSPEQKDQKAFSLVAQRLEILGQVKIPAPPAKLQKTLRPYQTAGFQFLAHLALRNLGGILADDMGLGKTLQTLCWLIWLKSKNAKLRVLIICPKSVTDNWIQESKKFETGLSAIDFKSPNHQPAALENANLVIANYSLLRLQSDYFLSEKWDVAILDEGQYIKNPSSQTAKTAFKLRAKHRLILSGTPIENKISDLWSLMQFAMPGLLGNQKTFLADFAQTDSAEALANLHKRLQPFILRRLKSQVAQDLPERIEEEVRCELEGEQRVLYLDELERARQALKQITPKTETAARFSILSSLLRLRQICCHPALIQKSDNTPPQSSAPPPDATSAKLSALLDLVEPIAAEGHQILIFSQFVSMLEILKNTLDSKQIGNLILTGKTQNRQKLVDQFQTDPSKTVFLLSLKAAGSGLNLTAASYVILYDPWWNPAVEAQAIDRTHRIGQTQHVIAYRILAKDTIEEKIRKLQADKASLAASVIHEESLAKSLNLADIRDLLA